MWKSGKKWTLCKNLWKELESLIRYVHREGNGNTRNEGECRNCAFTVRELYPMKSHIQTLRELTSPLSIKSGPLLSDLAVNVSRLHTLPPQSFVGQDDAMIW
jgi:hypothetical protein